MGTVKNALKKILPPPVNSFMREVNRIVALEEKNQHAIDKLTEIIARQEDQLTIQREALQYQEQQLQALMNAVEVQDCNQKMLNDMLDQQKDLLITLSKEWQLVMTKLQNDVMQSQQEQFTLLNAISESQCANNESIDKKMQSMERLIQDQIRNNNESIEMQKNTAKKQYDEQQHINKDLRIRIDNTNHEVNYRFFKGLHPDQYSEALEEWYYQRTLLRLDLDNPKTFNEKIQWLKLYDSTPKKTQLADKYLVREWVAEKIGEEYLIPLLGVYESFDDIDFDVLPNQFVIKANHGSGWNIVVKDKDKLDIKTSKWKFDSWMKKNFAFSNGLELHYKNIVPKIIVEQYIADLDENICDYRFFCFDGKPEYIWVDIGSGTTQHYRSIFDIDWNLQNYKVNYPEIVPVPKKPVTLECMTDLAIRLSDGFAFVRIDFYSIDEKIYFGEMTFTPQSGLAKWDDEKYNFEYGDKIKLNDLKRR